MINPLRIPAGRVRPVRLPDVRGPAIVLPVDSWDTAFLVAGEGDQAVACFLGDRFTYEGVPLTDAGDFKGLAYEDIEFEVDCGSMHSLEAGRPTPGSLVRSGGLLKLTYKAHQRFPGLMLVPVAQGLSEGSSNTDVAFSGWSALVTVGDQRFEVWRKDAIV